MTDETRKKANRIAHRIESLKGDIHMLKDHYNEFTQVKLTVNKGGTVFHTLNVYLTSDMDDSEFNREDVEAVLNGTKSLLYSVISCRLAKLERELEEL